MRPESKRRWDRAHGGGLGEKRPRGTAGQVRPAEVERMREMRARGMRVWQIALELNRGVTTVSRWTKP